MFSSKPTPAPSTTATEAIPTVANVATQSAHASAPKAEANVKPEKPKVGIDAKLQKLIEKQAEIAKKIALAKARAAESDRAEIEKKRSATMKKLEAAGVFELTEVELDSWLASVKK
jgi:chorismate mutase